MKMFTPTTGRQEQLVADIKRMFARQKEQAKVVQFSERDQEYFTTNLRVLTDRLKEESKMDLVINAETGEVQFEEEKDESSPASQHAEYKGADAHSAFKHHGYKRIHGHEATDVRIYKHPEGHVGMFHAGSNEWHHIPAGKGTAVRAGQGYRILHQHLKEMHGG